MTQRPACGSLLVTWLLVGCVPTVPGVPKGAAAMPSSIVIPAARAPRLTLTAEEAAMMLPDLTKLERDPFLTQLEEHPEEAPKPVLAVAAPKKRRAPAGPQPLVLKQLHESVTGIITGPRNTFFFQGKLFEEGDTLPDSDWVVISIKPAGIRLRSKDGATDFLPFASEPGGTFIINKSP